VAGVTKAQALRRLWEIGRLAEIKLHKGQLDVLERYQNTNAKIFVLNSSRRWGKSTLLLVICLMLAIQRSGSLIRYAASSAYQVRRFTTPLLKELLEDCPQDLRPTYRAQDKTWRFPNGSEIHIAGVDNGRAEALRGTSMDLGIVDEAAFIDDLPYLVKSVLGPQMLTTGGRLLISSTPNPAQIDHPFWDFVDDAKEAGAYATNTIYENPLLTPEQIQEAIDLCGGTDTDSFRIEYMAQRLRDSTWAVVPEFHEEAKAGIVQAVPRPPHYQPYTLMDLGYVDNTGILFGYYDFVEARLVIEDEAVLEKAITEEMAAVIKRKELELWGNKEIYQRYCDVDPRAQAELARNHDLVFTASPKDHKDAAINTLRTWIAQDKIRIHPRCEKLIVQLEQATWNKAKTDFTRTPKHGHYDLVDALIFGVRNVVTTDNPYPNVYAGKKSNDRYFVSMPKQRREGIAGLAQYIFNPNKYK